MTTSVKRLAFIPAFTRGISENPQVCLVLQLIQVGQILGTVVPAAGTTPIGVWHNMFPLLLMTLLILVAGRRPGRLPGDRKPLHPVDSQAVRPHRDVVCGHCEPQGGEPGDQRG